MAVCVSVTVSLSRCCILPKRLCDFHQILMGAFQKLCHTPTGRGKQQCECDKGSGVVRVSVTSHKILQTYVQLCTVLNNLSCAYCATQ